jgi:Flp pilus assembly protein TadD
MRSDMYNADIYNAIGISLMRLERYKEAVDYLNEAVRLKPEDIHFRFNLATTYRDMEYNDNAIAEYKKLALYCHDYINMYNNLAGIYIVKGLRDKAMQAYYKEIGNTENKLKRAPDDINLLNTLAVAYNGVGEHDKARLIINNAFRLGAEGRDLYLTLAKIEEDSHNYVKAREAMEKARLFSPSFSDSFISHNLKRIDRYISDLARIVYLKNGRAIEGTIERQDKDSIILETKTGGSKGFITLMKDDIEDIAIKGD